MRSAVSVVAAATEVRRLGRAQAATMYVLACTAVGVLGVSAIAVVALEQPSLITAHGPVQLALGLILLLLGCGLAVYRFHRGDPPPQSWAYVVTGAVMVMGSAVVDTNIRTIFSLALLTGPAYAAQRIPTLRIRGSAAVAAMGVVALSASAAGSVQMRSLRSLLALLVILPLVAALVVLRRRSEDERRALRSAAWHDPLTGLLNRRGLRAALPDMLRDARTDKKALAVLLVDIDYFKAVNDTHGHDVGDTVIIMVASRLLEQCRKQDLVARVGGEEFAVVLALPTGSAVGTQSLGVVVELAERMRTAVLSTTVLPDLKVRVSIGGTIASMAEPIGDEGLAFQHWYHDADRALMRAKAEGRDRCIVEASSRVTDDPHAERPPGAHPS